MDVKVTGNTYTNTQASLGCDNALAIQCEACVYSHKINGRTVKQVCFPSFEASLSGYCHQNDQI